MARKTISLDEKIDKAEAAVLVAIWMGAHAEKK